MAGQPLERADRPPQVQAAATAEQLTGIKAPATPGEAAGAGTLQPVDRAGLSAAAVAALREVEGYERAEVGVRAEGAAQIAVITLPGGGGPVEGLEVDLTEYPGKPPLGLLPPGTGDAERERFAQAFVAKVSGGFRRGVGRPWCPGCVALAGRTARRQCAGPDWRALSSRLGPGPGPGRGGAGPGQVLAPSLAGAERGCGRRGGVAGCERVQKMALLRAIVTRLNTTPPVVS